MKQELNGTLGDEATMYRDAGLKVLPLEGKSPKVASWQNVEFSDQQLKEYLSRYESPGIGVQMGPKSGLVDLEHDSPEQHAKIKAMFGGEIPRCPAFVSKNGGHYLFKWNERLEATNAANLYIPCDGGEPLIVRIGAGGKGSQSAFPPSKDKVWMYQRSITEIDAPELPDKVLDYLVSSVWVSDNDPAPVTDFDVIPDVVDILERNTKNLLDGNDGSHRLFTVACRCVGLGLSDQVAIACVREYQMGRPFPKRYTDREIIARLRSAERQVERGEESNDFDSVEVREPTVDLGWMPVGEFLAKDYSREWLINKVLVSGEPFLVAGPQKALKTSLAFDMGLSLSTGTPFLGYGPFSVSRPMPVAIMSGESGGASLQVLIKSILKERGLKYNDETLFIGERLPHISLESHLNALQKNIERYGIRYACIDPAYMCALKADASESMSNVFAMGTILAGLSRISVETGCTMGMVHHTKKASSKDKFSEPNFTDTAGAGWTEWMRQWMVISHRERYSHGRFKIWATFGGSAGADGLYGFDVDLGRPEDPLLERDWKVTVYTEEDLRVLEDHAGSVPEAVSPIVDRFLFDN